jgi:glycosyltransferase involved in cell wall biosynthesis
VKVLHVINSLVLGGAETLLYNSLLKFDELYPGIQHHVIVVYDRGHYYKDRVNARWAYKNLKCTKWNFPSKIIELRNYIKHNGFDIVHAHLYDAMILSRLSLPLRVKLVETYHSEMYEPGSVDFSLKRLFIDKLTYRKKYFSLFVSERVKQVITSQVAIRQSKVLPNFPAERFIPVYTYKPDKHLKLVSVGTLRRHKNYPLAIRALSKFSEVSLDLIGSGILHDELTILIRDSKSNVKLLQTREVDSAFFNEYDMFLMTSDYEGMPISLLEALASGMPALLTDLPQMHETAGDAAIYFERNSVIDLKKKLLEIVNSKTRLISLSENAKKAASKFSASSYVENLFQIYSSLLSNNK